VLTSAFHGTDAELKALEGAVLAAPHDFAAHAKLDYALSTRRDSSAGCSLARRL
jgi:hypothetical protein